MDQIIAGKRCVCLGQFRRQIQACCAGRGHIASRGRRFLGQSRTRRSTGSPCWTSQGSQRRQEQHLEPNDLYFPAHQRVGHANAIRHHPPRQPVPFFVHSRCRPWTASQSCAGLKQASSEIWPKQPAQDKPLPRKENSPPSEPARHRQPIANRPRWLRPNRCRPSPAPAPARRR